ncbi:MAG: c-type cytochrome [Gammaproteobacteria bacterium]|nr:c-type cytochrome [Gammaproteobacteria bacterium]
MKNLLLILSLSFLSIQLQAADLANGKALNKNCALCHGIYGQGASGQLSPRLAGLPKDYLIKVMNDYRKGIRQNYLMLKTIALDDMTDKDIEDVSAYLAAIDLTSDPSFDVVQSIGEVEAGRMLFNSECKTCHAKDGFGKPKKEAPPLAGQHSEYMIQSIKMFQGKVRLHDNDEDDETFDDFSDDELTDLTAFITTLDNARMDMTGNTKFYAPNVVAKRAEKTATKLAKSDLNNNKLGGLHITDIKQTVARMPLEDGVTIEDAVQSMMSKAAELNLKLVGSQQVSKELESRGVDSPFLAIYQFCNPMDAKTMVVSNPIFASYMPCRISVVEDQNNKIWLMMLNLDMLIDSELLDPKIVDVAVRVNQSMLEIMVSGATGDF